jgi:ATP-binding cassette subfamily B (MDR/TAP) protein 1
MFVIGLVFFYGSRLVSTLEFSNFQFFVGLMVRVLPSELYTL